MMPMQLKAFGARLRLVESLRRAFAVPEHFELRLDRRAAFGLSACLHAHAALEIHANDYGCEHGQQSREPRAESREPRAESREPRAESREPRCSSLRSSRAIFRCWHDV